MAFNVVAYITEVCIWLFILLVVVGGSFGGGQSNDNNDANVVGYTDNIYSWERRQSPALN